MEVLIPGAFELEKLGAPTEDVLSLELTELTEAGGADDPDIPVDSPPPRGTSLAGAGF